MLVQNREITNLNEHPATSGTCIKLPGTIIPCFIPGHPYSPYMIGGYKFATVDELVTTPDKINLASVREIGAMKLLSITHRAVIRDYLDLAVIMRDHASLEDLLDMAARKYGARFNWLLPLRALVSFDDLAGEWPVLIDETIRHSWQSILRQAVKGAA